MVSRGSRRLSVRIPLATGRDQAVPAAAGPRVGGATGGAAPSFYLVDRASGKMLLWKDDVVRVKPYSKDPPTAWRFRKVTAADCAYWARVSHRHNRSTTQWALRVASLVMGACDADCRALARSIEPSLGNLARNLDGGRLDPAARASVCAAACGATSAISQDAAPARLPARLPGCFCEAAPPLPDCGCMIGAGARRHYSLDATPLLHRLPAVW
jgi:hypothetical protein